MNDGGEEPAARNGAGEMGSALDDGSLISAPAPFTNRTTGPTDANVPPAFLLELSDAMRPLTDPAAVQATAAQVLGERLGVDRAHYVTVDDASAEYVIEREWHRSAAPGHARRYPLADWPMPWPIDERLVIADANTDPALPDSQRAAYRGHDIGACVVVPLIRDGRLAATLVVNQQAPRAWTADDVAMVEATASRTWSAVETMREQVRRDWVRDEALRDSEARYRTLFDRIDEGFCVLEVLFDDGDGTGAPQPVDYRFLETNPSFVRQGGFDPLANGSPSPRMSEIAPIEPAWIAIYGRVAATGEPTRFTHEAASFGRTYDAFAFRVDAPEARHVAVLFRDISAELGADAAREQLHAELAAERERLRSVILHTPAPLALLEGPAHRFTLVNDAYKRVSGGGRDITGLTPPEAFPELAGSGIYELFDQVYATGVAWDGPETPVRYDRDGTGIQDTWFNLRFEPVRDAHGKVIAILNFAVDVTEQVRARQRMETMLAESEAARHEADLARRDADTARHRTEAIARFTSVLASMRSAEDVHDVVVEQARALFGAEGAVVALRSDNGRSLELVGVSGMADHLHTAWIRFPVDAPGPLAEVSRTGQPRHLESRAEWAAAYPTLLDTLDAQGHVAHMVLPLTVGDRTMGALGIAFSAERAFGVEDRMLALALARQCAQAIERVQLFEGEQSARKEAEAANRAKSEFLAVMSHELRTPLNAIDGYAELIELGIRGPVTDEQRQDLTRIRKSQKHLLGLINGVLNYAQIEAGAVHYDMEPVGLDDVLATCEALTAPQVRAKSLTLRRQPCDSSIVVRGDREKLQQIVLNLLSNATKFTEAGGRIEVRWVRTRDERGPIVQVKVADTGIGIAANQLARVFEPFVQVDSELTRTGNGTGLGLAISRDLARGMGGELSGESTLGVGSTFTLVLRAE